VASIQRYWKQDLKWNNPGYHFIIDDEGYIEQLQPIEKLANGVKGFNSNSIHVAYIGGLNGKDTRSIRQTLSIINIVKYLANIFPEAEILGHKDFPGVKKECPAFNVKQSKII
jgi:N-acetylmuramoyl-L-alanine amidase